jgi:hypothetical protein
VSKQQFSKWSKHYNGAKSPPSHDSEVFGPQLFSKNKNKEFLHMDDLIKFLHKFVHLRHEIPSKNI